MKKIISVFMALAMILSLNTTAFAENYTLTINDAAGHKYDIYQIYTGDASGEEDENGAGIVLSNVKYGENPYPSTGALGSAVPDTVLKNLQTATDPVSLLKTVMNGDPYMDDVVPEAGATSIELKIPAGYYMIVDDSDHLSEETKSPVILQVLGDAVVTSKHAEITSEKKVDDKNDSKTAEDGVEWQDSADYDIGDDVPFQLSVTLPSTMKDYDEYELTFHDKQAVGFGDPKDFKAYILKADDTQIAIDGLSAGNCTDVDCEFGTACSFTVHVDDVKDLYGSSTFTEGDKLIVKYTAELQNDAEIGSAGNENGMYVCHPDGKTPVDYVTVFTYELKIDKIDGTTKDELNGAGFTLHKYNAVKGEWDAIGGEITGGTSFTWTGIDDGEYKLVETTTPEGYNTIEPIVFTVTADHEAEWTKGGASAFEGLSVDGADFLDNNGVLEGDVENYTGIVLPETGGRGTAMLIGISSVLVVLAAIFMITRKKMSIYED